MLIAYHAKVKSVELSLIFLENKAKTPDLSIFQGFLWVFFGVSLVGRSPRFSYNFKVMQR